MKVEIIAPSELGDAEFSRWTGMQSLHADLTSPFLSPHFAAACGRAWPGSRVAVLSPGDAGVGFFPFYRGRSGMGRPLGHKLSDVQGVVAPRAAEMNFGELLSACGLRLWRFDHLLAWQRKWFVDTPHRSMVEFSPAVDVSGGWQAYEEAQRATSNSILSSTARKRRKLERDHGPVSLVFHEPDHALLDRVLRLKSEQYRRTGRRDLFADGAVRRLVHDLLDLDTPAFGATLTVLRAGEHVVSAHMGLRSSTTIAWWFPVYAPDFAGYSPGLTLCLELLRVMGERGLRLLDLGKGDEQYKKRLANAQIPLLRGAVGAGSLTVCAEACRRWPQERLMAMVLGSPRLRSAARHTLAWVGSKRSQTSR